MSKTAFILGGGPRVGTSVANALVKKGYKVAIGRRTIDSASSAEGITSVKLDLGSTASITAAFKEVTSSLGTPHVVIYNGATLSAIGAKEDPFNADVEGLKKDIDVNITGVYTALTEAVKGFKTVSADLPKVFIVTGNILPFSPVPHLFSLGVGKSGAVHLIHSAIAAETYAKAGYRFYFASEVTQDGGPVYTGLSGEAHAKKYIELIEEKEQDPKGYDVRFKA
jgi:NAD(P)-dependent dehydrogenase (short-subunit alcohol dehydrogenase family)